MSMKMVKKWHLEREGITRIPMKKGARVISVGEQKGGLVMWVIDDAEPADLDKMETRTFDTILTGSRFDGQFNRVFIGTVLMHGGSYVAHVFEVAE